MTPDKDALQALLDKVEAGTVENDGSMYRIFGDDWVHCFDAYGGSLDAAKALHEAVLPEWDWTVPHRNNFAVYRLENGIFKNGLGYHKEVPARAWLCAILKALIEEASE